MSLNKGKQQRPKDGPGANGLRGGKPVYSSNVCIGDYISDVGGPAMYKFGFTTPDFSTSTGGETKLEYGAGLPVHVTIDKPSTFDLFAPSKALGDSSWQSTTRGTYVPHDRYTINKADNDPVLSTSNELEEYRKTWTQETGDIARKFRFQVESRMKSSNTAIAKFEPQDIRLLPGTPMSIEKFRRKLIDRFGILSFTALRAHLPKNKLNLSALRKLVHEMEIHVTKSEIEQMFSYFTPYDSLESDYLLKTILTKVPGYKNDFAVQLSKASVPDPQGNLSGKDFVSRFVSSEVHPEVAEGLSLFISAYTDYEGYIRETGIHTLCYDLYASAPYDFVNSTKTLWNIA